MIHTNMVGLKFLLNHSSFVVVVVSEDFARIVVKNWMSGWYQLKDVPIIGEADGPIGAWAVKVSEIQAIHTFNPQEMQQPQSMQPAALPLPHQQGLPNWKPGTSGVGLR